MEEKEAAAGRASEKKRNRKRRRILRQILAAAVTLALVVLAVLAFAYRDRLTGEGLRSIFRRDAAGAARSDAFTYEVGAGQVFAAVGNGLAVVSSSSAELMDAAGMTVFRQVVSFETPAVFPSARGALFCDLDGAGCFLAGLDGESMPLTPAGAVLTASMNESGWFTLVTEAAGYKALVTVYDGSAAPKYEWWSGTGYVLKAAVSPDNRLLAVLCAETGGGKLRLFRLDSEEEQAAVEFENELPFDFSFMGNDALCILSENALSFAAADGSVKSRVEWEEEALLDYDFGSQSFAALYTGVYRAGGGTLRTFDREGKQLGAAEAERDVTGLSASGRQLLTMTGGGLAVYGQDLSPLRETEALITAKKAILRPDGDVLLLSAYSAERLRF